MKIVMKSLLAEISFAGKYKHVVLQSFKQASALKKKFLKFSWRTQNKAQMNEVSNQCSLKWTILK